MHVAGQTGLGGCMYVLHCCVCQRNTESPQLQWLNGRLLIMNQLLDTQQDKFSASHIGEGEFTELAHQILVPMIEFAVMAITKAGSQQRTKRHAKKVIMHSSK